MPEGRSVLLNSRGELRNEHHTYLPTCLSLSRRVDMSFPPLPLDVVDDDFDGHDNDDHDDGKLSELSAGVTAGGGSGGDVGSGQIDRTLSPPRPAGGDWAQQGCGREVGESGAAGGSAGEREGGDAGSGHSPVLDPAVAASDAVIVPRVAAAAAAAAAAADGDDIGGGVCGATPSIAPRRGWEGLGLRREKSFYPNRAAAKDEFTDFNFWRGSPHVLIGDEY